MDEKEILKNIISILETQEDMKKALMSIGFYCEYFTKEPARVVALRPKENLKNRRRNNPIDMTLSEQILKAKSEMCREYCKYTDVKRRGEISQETLDDICEYDCPLNKL